MPLNYDEYLQASNGTGEAVRSNVVVARIIGSTEINVDTVLNWPNKFIATSGTLDPATGQFNPATVTVFFGHINGTYLHIDEFAPGYSDRGNAQNEIIVLKPTTSWADKVALRVSLPAGGTAAQVLTKNSSTPGDASWTGLPNLSSWVADQGLAGTVNGSNTVFTTASNFAAIIIYKNGVTLHVGDDYTITGSNQITFITAPATGTKLTCTYVTSTTAQIVGSGTTVSDQPVTGLVNGSNTVFATPQPYVGGTLEVYVNGQKQVRTTHFTETTPSNGAFTLSDAPLTGDVICISCQLSLTVSGNASTVAGVAANSSPTANTLLPLDANAKHAATGFYPPTKHVVGGTGEPAYQNSWIAYPGWAPSYFFKTLDNIVTVCIMTKSGTLNSTIFTLPAGYRPLANVSGCGRTDSGAVLTDVQSNGAIATEGATTNGWFAFNITFLAEQ